jgi:hypothetical protein
MSNLMDNNTPLRLDRLGHSITGDNRTIHLIVYDKPIADDEFWCVICGDARSIKGGFVASFEIGGWACSWHTLEEVQNNTPKVPMKKPI